MAVNLPGPRDPEYWSRDALVAEEKRVFEVCNGCRLCFNLCPSFPALFDAVDALDTSSSEPLPPPSEVDAFGNHAAATGGEHAAAPRADVLGQHDALQQIPLTVHQKVVDLCYQCKLCDPICPYTPPHEFAVDFPRLMLRHKAIDAREHGVSVQDQVLGDPDRIGRIGTSIPTIANFGTTFAPNRIAMEKTVGIHRDRKLPLFAEETFLAWFRRRHPTRPAPAEVTGPKVVLFYTCSVQWNEPQVGRAAVEVLEHSGVTVFCPEMRCCGMPALDGGDVAQATDWAARNVAILAPYVEAGCEIVSPGPTCSFMIKKEWHDYLGSDAAKRVGANAFDLMEYLARLKKEGRLREDYQEEVGRIAYHLPCHLKVQKIGYKSRDLMKKLPGAEVTLVNRCSCMDGTWGMKTEYYELSKKGSAKLMDEMKAGEAPTWVSDCLIAKLQLEEQSDRKVKHPIEILWAAYGGKEGRSIEPLPPIALGDR